MLGNVIERQVAPIAPKISNVFMDRLLSNWSDNWEYNPPTLMIQDAIWKEFWLSVSDTKNWCPRALALRALNDSFSVPVQPELSWRMKIGKAYHSMMQNDIMRMAYGKDLIGAWSEYGRPIPVDMNVEDVVSDGSRRIVERPMIACPGDKYMYNESKIRMPGHRIVMKLDGIVLVDGEMEVQEFKTEQSNAMDSLNMVMGGKPRQHHVEQLNLCMWGSGVHRGRLIYVFKGDQTMISSIMECEIAYDQDLIDMLKRKAMACVHAVEKCDKWKEDHADVNSEFYEDEKIKFLDSFERLVECPMKSKGRAATCYARDLCFTKKVKKAA